MHLNSIPCLIDDTQLNTLHNQSLIKDNHEKKPLLSPLHHNGGVEWPKKKKLRLDELVNRSNK